MHFAFGRAIAKLARTCHLGGQSEGDRCDFDGNLPVGPEPARALERPRDRAQRRQAQLCDAVRNNNEATLSAPRQPRDHRRALFAGT